MLKCPSCAAEIRQGWQYCPACGKLPKISTGPSYSATWIFAGIGLLAVLFYWAAMSGNTETSTPVLQPKPVPDDAAILIEHCGKPDVDSIIPARVQPTAPKRWSLLYRSAKVRAVFESDSTQSSAGWRNVKYFDAVSGKLLNPQQVLKRLPCAVKAASSS